VLSLGLYFPKKWMKGIRDYHFVFSEFVLLENNVGKQSEGTSGPD
jgi:hypothetical protein